MFVVLAAMFSTICFAVIVRGSFSAPGGGVRDMEAMEEWAFIDDAELQGWKGACICMTCQHFTYGVDQHCHTLLGCTLRQKQLQQGEHLKKKCKLWAPTWQKEMGWAPEAG